MCVFLGVGGIYFVTWVSATETRSCLRSVFFSLLPLNWASSPPPTHLFLLSLKSSFQTIPHFTHTISTPWQDVSVRSVVWVPLSLIPSAWLRATIYIKRLISVFQGVFCHPLIWFCLLLFIRVPQSAHWLALAMESTFVRYSLGLCPKIFPKVQVWPAGTLAQWEISEEKISMAICPPHRLESGHLWRSGFMESKEQLETGEECRGSVLSFLAFSLPAQRSS